MELYWARLCTFCNQFTQNVWNCAEWVQLCTFNNQFIQNAWNCIEHNCVYSIASLHRMQGTLLSMVVYVFVASLHRMRWWIPWYKPSKRSVENFGFCLTIDGNVKAWCSVFWCRIFALFGCSGANWTGGCSADHYLKYAYMCVLPVYSMCYAVLPYSTAKSIRLGLFRLSPTWSLDKHLDADKLSNKQSCDTNRCTDQKCGGVKTMKKWGKGVYS